MLTGENSGEREEKVSKLGVWIFINLPNGSIENLKGRLR